MDLTSPSSPGYTCTGGWRQTERGGWGNVEWTERRRERGGERDGEKEERQGGWRELKEWEWWW